MPSSRSERSVKGGPREDLVANAHQKRDPSKEEVQSELVVAAV
jgi:hypothetical protein